VVRERVVKGVFTRVVVNPSTLSPAGSDPKMRDVCGSHESPRHSGLSTKNCRVTTTKLCEQVERRLFDGPSEAFVSSPKTLGVEASAIRGCPARSALFMGVLEQRTAQPLGPFQVQEACGGSGPMVEIVCAFGRQISTDRVRRRRECRTAPSDLDAWLAMKD